MTIQKSIEQTKREVDYGENVYESKRSHGGSGCFRVLCLQIDPKTQQRAGKDRVCYDTWKD